MTVSLNQLCAILEVVEPRIKATPFTEEMQIMVSFINRQDERIAFLTPEQQHRIVSGIIDLDTIAELISKIRELASL